MKNSRIFMATGGLLLAICAIFATKANKQFMRVTTLVGGNADCVITFKDIASNFFTTKSGGGGKLVYAQVLTTKRTAPGAIVNVQMYTVTGTKPVYSSF